MGYLILIFAVVMQLCLGATYSWSVYVKDIKAILNISQAQAQLPFSVFYFIFPATMIISGKILKKLGPQISTIVGGTLFGAGWIISSFGGSNFIFTILGNGLIAGLGAGIAYIVPISTCIKWFPDKKGLITGIAVAGFGGGAALVSFLGGTLIANGWTPFQVFRALGSIFLILIILAGFFMKNPPSNNTHDTYLPLKYRELLVDKKFLFLYFAMFVGLAAGFAVNANIKELSRTASMTAGVSAVAFFAIFNALGRVSWGALFDRFDYIKSLQLNLLFQAIILFLSPIMLNSATGLQIFAVLTGLNYGGVLVMYAGSVAKIWGAENVGMVYGLLFSSNIPGALAPIFAGYIYDKTGSFTIALYTIAILLILGIIILNRLRRL
ncbi:MFS transporter [Calditerrivibrio nitroreducens]|uniref:Major facilitator superfamily MFS_1 n=1 Tax=Calditerrivibrio nitroreducens (strain DSM 19672 / NBRC 101217 / Yu37-1) TaxID=768670 RepID=E4TJL4_CALNY|nr:MFS transporter [Calditerrivibrio nitroreducens]ADR18176.1 major facilitator superfamily MFS_1 [Calditerrivibrio nitroreducens DSM 19672]